MNNNKRNIRSEALNLLRFPLACVVVTIHLFNNYILVVQGVNYNLSDFPGFMSIALFARAFLHGVSVPVYFFIAGYVFFLGINLTMEKYWRKMQNRFKSLLIPYMLWNSLAILFFMIPYIPWLHSVFPNSDWNELHFTIKGILDSFWIYNPDSTFFASVESTIVPPINCNIQ